MVGKICHVCGKKLVRGIVYNPDDDSGYRTENEMLVCGECYVIISDEPAEEEEEDDNRPMIQCRYCDRPVPVDIAGTPDPQAWESGWCGECDPETGADANGFEMEEDL